MIENAMLAIIHGKALTLQFLKLGAQLTVLCKNIFFLIITLLIIIIF